MDDNAMVVANVTWDVDTAVNDAKIKHSIVKRVMQEVMVKGHDYDKIGNSKETLLKPGAERLCSSFKLTPEFVPLTVTEDWANGFFHYRYRVDLTHYPTGTIVGSGVGSCNSKEDKYGWRWVDILQVPHDLDPSTLQSRDHSISEFKFAIDKAQTSGDYGKPQQYWDDWQEAIKAGDAIPIKRKTSKGNELDAFEWRRYKYRIPNPDVFSIVNTIDKMAQKRALIAAVLVATNASDFFTQDIEDLPEFNQGNNAPRPQAEKYSPEWFAAQSRERTMAIIDDEFGYSNDGLSDLIANDREQFDKVVDETNANYAAFWIAQSNYLAQQEEADYDIEF